MKRNGFAFKLDYDKEIAADEKLISQLTYLIDNRLFKPLTVVVEGAQKDVSSYSVGLHTLMFMDVNGVAASLGLTLADLSDLACAIDYYFTCIQLDGSVVELPKALPGAYKRGAVIVDRLRTIWEGDLYSEAMALKVLKKAKSDLARHRRNKARHGVTT